MKDIGDKMEALVKHIAAQKAVSLEGAVIQLMCLYDRVHIAATMSSDDENNSADLDREITRLGHSIMDILLRRVNIKGEDFALSRFMGAHCNPWIDVTARIADAYREPFADSAEHAAA